MTLKFTESTHKFGAIVLLVFHFYQRVYSFYVLMSLNFKRIIFKKCFNSEVHFLVTTEFIFLTGNEVYTIAAFLSKLEKKKLNID